VRQKFPSYMAPTNYVARIQYSVPANPRRKPFSCSVILPFFSPASLRMFPFPPFPFEDLTGRGVWYAEAGPCCSTVYICQTIVGCR
jgi:hypothetical protein